MSRVSPPTWSLEVEVQYYLLAPLFAAVFLVRPASLRRALLLGIVLALGVATQGARAAAPRVALSIAGNLQYFTAGLLLCDLYLTQPLRRIPAWMWDLVAVAALIPLLWSEATWVRELFPLGSVAILLAGMKGRQVRRFFAAPMVSVTGGMCYSLYLTHGTVLALVAAGLAAAPGHAAPAGVRTLEVIGASLAATFAAGGLFYVLIERPCMDPGWPRKAAALLWPRRAGTAPA
jgi:peptidoglycan/LPS O-acetylase OafA/YrhL